MKPSRGKGFAAVRLRGVCAGSIESSSGSAMDTPRPRKKVRRGRCFFVRNIPVPVVNLSQLRTRGTANAGGGGSSPASLHGCVVPAYSANPDVAVPHRIAVILKHQRILGRLRCVVGQGAVNGGPLQFFAMVQENAVQKHREIGGFYELFALKPRGFEDD